LKPSTLVQRKKERKKFLSKSDQLISQQTKDQAMQDFFRLMNTNQLIYSLLMVSISNKAFMNGYHIIAYDLTSCQDGGSQAFANPSVRVGNYNIIIFN
jgi:hypothetical protein